jgi:predicted transcriptional regulator
MEINLEKITPVMASKYLENALQNRKIKKETVKQYSSDMKKGFWVLSPQPIVFDESGKLMDGQHRLLAVIDSKTPIDFIVARNVPKTAIFGIDMGTSRSASDLFAINGECEELRNRAKFNLYGRRKVSYAEIKQEYLAFINSYKYAYKTLLKNCVRKQRGIFNSYVMFAIAELYNNYSDYITDMFVDILSLNNVNPKDADTHNVKIVIALRNKLFDIYTRNTDGSFPVDKRRYMYKATKYAFNEFVKNSKIKYIRNDL